MSIVIDLIVIGILALCIFLGYKRGLVGVAFKLFSFVIAVAVALIFCRPVTNFIVAHTEWDDSLRSQIVETMNHKNTTEGKEETEENRSTPEVFINYINQTIENETQEAKDSIVEQTAESLAYDIINLGVILVLFLATKIILWIVHFFTKFLTDLPILKQFNTLGGVLFGIIEGFFWLYLILAICSILPIESLQTAIASSYIASIFYNYNLILMILF